MTAPVIGIPLGLDDRGRWRQGRDYQYLDAAYADAVASAGGMPLYLPIQDAAAALVARCDGLLLPGGDDFLPHTPSSAYADVSFDPAPERQLDFDRALLAAARAGARPVFGICYGMQLLALEHGGALFHHLPLDRPDAGPHDHGEHGLRIEPDTRLAALLGSGPVCVNTRHHQAVRTPGDGLRIGARSEDGVIEAIESSEPPFRLGVQWHPETMDAPHRLALFGAFVTACGAR